MANGKGGADPRDREIRELKKEVESRDQVIGELTIANRILKKTSTYKTLFEPFSLERKLEVLAGTGLTDSASLSVA